ncbi:stage II sporulation protein R [Paenibacillus hemerocallicola]|uniref:Stage II sporulation protein R n=1 Tax=Paenibacillus hemerocallicola TaxID=1172614 RepID=A0A5C4T8I6_9BACL|nr:stage II sporulation protein R [Paenibacillus hemerocallicola]TNJ64697.1 stage II sporulation protein R [Paenibacillus hemerocallicola]
MVKRLSFRSYWFVAFALIVMVTCWDSNRTQAALLDSGIPEESIRLRILANSDAPNDQLVKRIVRDEVIRQMGEWVTEPEGIAAARNAVHLHLAELESLVGAVLTQNGYNYAYTVEIGQVPFPAKIYGNKVYPAGDYEALRITLGKGEGQNWWCVLFPPLCFVDGNAGVAVAKKAADGTKTAMAPVKADAAAEATDSGPQVEVKFFLLEVLVKVISFVKGLLA